MPLGGVYDDDFDADRVKMNYGDANEYGSINCACP